MQATNSSEKSSGKWLDRWFTYENGLLLLLGFIFGIVFFERNALALLTPFIILDLDLNNTQLGMLSSGLALTWALSAYFIGSWSDRSGVRKPFLVVAIVIFSLCSILSGLAGSFIFLLAARVIMGAAEGPFLPICFSIMNVESSPERRGINAGILQNVFAALLGTIVAPFLLVYLAQLYGWRITFFLSSLPGLVCALLVWKYVHEPKSAVPEEVTVQTSDLEATKGWGVLRMLQERNILICALVACCMVAWYLIGFTFLPVFFVEYRGFSVTEMAGLISVSGFATILCGFLVPGLSDKIGRKPVVIIFSFIGIVTPLAALYFNGPVWALGVFMFIGWSATGAFPIFMGVIPGETVSRKFAATSMGLVVCIGELVGGFGAPSVAGWLADQSSLATPIMILGGCALCAGFLGFFLIETAPSKVKTLEA